MVADRFSFRNYVCFNDHIFRCGRWESQDTPKCPECGSPTEIYYRSNNFGVAPGVVADEIPGGIDIRHGLCNEDGSPRRYYSKTEIRREAAKRGLVIAGETPNPTSEFSDKRDREDAERAGKRAN